MKYELKIFKQQMITKKRTSGPSIGNSYKNYNLYFKMIIFFNKNVCIFHAFIIYKTENNNNFYISDC